MKTVMFSTKTTQQLINETELKPIFSNVTFLPEDFPLPPSGVSFFVKSRIVVGHETVFLQYSFSSLNIMIIQAYYWNYGPICEYCIAVGEHNYLSQIEFHIENTINETFQTSRAISSRTPDHSDDKGLILPEKYHFKLCKKL